MANTGELTIPMLMGDWVLIMEASEEKIRAMKSVDPSSMDEDDRADMYTDQQNLEGILAQVKREFQKEYGSLPADH